MKELYKDSIGLIAGGLLIPSFFSAAINLGVFVLPAAVLGAEIGYLAVKFLWK